tara:strand:+ start:205 stop:564 length:360 start_codon:yes stop_codon:yes gene_type:complete
MNNRQRGEIRNFNDFPKTRADQEVILRNIMGYSKLRDRPLEICSDGQIYMVARRLYDQAHQPERTKQTTKRTKKPDLFYARLVRVAERDYAHTLYDIFNIPEAERDQIEPESLEAELLR